MAQLLEVENHQNTMRVRIGVPMSVPNNSRPRTCMKCIYYPFNKVPRNAAHRVACSTKYKKMVFGCQKKNCIESHDRNHPKILISYDF